MAKRSARSYVEKTFGDEGKQRTLEMVNEIEQAMGKDIEAITWMSPETKKQALVKLKRDHQQDRLSR